MVIQKRLTIEVIQKIFNAVYPGLQIRFYKILHEVNQGSPQIEEYAPSLRIEEIQPELVDGSIGIENTKTVAEFEREMEEKFGLHVQVFRKSLNLWLQTITTDNWTLEAQNNKGMRSAVV